MPNTYKPAILPTGMPSFWKTVNKVIEDADIILHVLDARFTSETRNWEVEHKIEKADKPIIYVINKCDLADKALLEAKKKAMKNTVFVSSKEYHGLNILKEKIAVKAKKLHLEKPVIGVLGYPNVGKSSLINALKGKAAAGTSSKSGTTRGVQKITKRKLIFLDTPGVIPYEEKNDAKHAMTGTKDINMIKDPEDAFYQLLSAYPRYFQEKYKINEVDDEVFLEKLAEKQKFLLKGNKPDTKRAARFILKAWQEGS